MDMPYQHPEDVLISNTPSQFRYWKESTYFSIVFLVVPLTLFTAIFALHTIRRHQEPQVKTVQVYAALPETIPAVSGNVIGSDARVAILQRYLELNKSPMEPYADFLVQTADVYHLDWKLLPAIAQKESGLCRVIPEGSHNCWGWGIHSKGTLMFDNYKESIDTVAKGLKEKYIDMGYTTPEKIMKKYAHPDSTTWADGVLMYMDQIRTLPLSSE